VRRADELAQAHRAIVTDWVLLARAAKPAPPAPATPKPPPRPAATCSATAHYSSHYDDYDVYVHSDQPNQTVTVTGSSGQSATWHTDSSGYTDVYFRAGRSAAGETVTVRVGAASCSTTLLFHPLSARAKDLPAGTCEGGGKRWLKALGIPDVLRSQRSDRMIGVPIGPRLALACERRVGRVVHVASTFNLRRIASPAGNFQPRKPLRVVTALTDDELWLLELRQWGIGFHVGAVLCRFPRHCLVAEWRHRPWAWPAVWKVELSWPLLATYVVGSLIGGEDADTLMGLLTADEFDGVRTMPTETDER
jgi:hypothetical protein